MKFNTAYSPKKRVQTTANVSGLTKQSFKDECDINHIIRNFQKTGVLSHENQRNPEYGFASAKDFRDSMEIVTKAQQLFEELPSQIRAQFGNSPEAFFDFAQNPDNASKMVEMGLSKPTKATTQENQENPEGTKIDPSPTKAEPIPAQD